MFIFSAILAKKILSRIFSTTTISSYVKIFKFCKNKCTHEPKFQMNSTLKIGRKIDWTPCTFNVNDQWMDEQR